MIITKTPFRITLGGGGTDLPGYYSKYGGFLVSAAINKFMYIVVNERFDSKIRVSYSKTEIVTDVHDIQHPIVRESLKYLQIFSSIEIISVADLPARSGLGSSGSFTVGLLHALHAFKGEEVTPKVLAEEAFHIEANILNEPVGKQDQYIAAFGGVISMTIDTKGNVDVGENFLKVVNFQDLEKSLLFFYTGIQRKSTEILEEQNNSAKGGSHKVVESMHRIKEIGLQCYDGFLKGDLDSFGLTLDEHWKMKRKISGKMSDKFIDRCYDSAISHGSLGGKIMGAGGGGFFMFYCSRNQKKVIKELERIGLIQMFFKISKVGSFLSFKDG